MTNKTVDENNNWYDPDDKSIMKSDQPSDLPKSWTTNEYGSTHITYKNAQLYLKKLLNKNVNIDQLHNLCTIVFESKIYIIKILLEGVSSNTILNKLSKYYDEKYKNEKNVIGGSMLYNIYEKYAKNSNT